MSRVEIPSFVEEKRRRQAMPPMDATLKRCDCEIGNLLEHSLMPLHIDDRAALEDLHRQVRAALGDPTDA